MLDGAGGRVGYALRVTLLVVCAVLATQRVCTMICIGKLV